MSATSPPRCSMMTKISLFIAQPSQNTQFAQHSYDSIRHVIRISREHLGAFTALHLLHQAHFCSPANIQVGYFMLFNRGGFHRLADAAESDVARRLFCCL